MGVLERPSVVPTSARWRSLLDHRGPRVGVLFYRAHQASGNTDFAHALADAIDATGEAVGVPIFSSSLRAAPDDLYDALGTLDALIVTVLAAGGSQPATASGRRRGRGLGRASGWPRSTSRSCRGSA